jgi:hypothetical protein
MMRSFYPQWFACVLVVGGVTSCLFAASPAKPVATVRSVTVTSSSDGIDIEIEASPAVAPRTQVVTNPDRLILDFTNALPSSDLRNQTIKLGEVKGIRVGLFSRNPPVTRVVVDLRSPQHYRIFPIGATVIVKLMSDEQQAAMRAHVDTVSYQPVPLKPEPKLAVEYKDGRMSIWSNKASLAEVLGEIQRKTGTEIPIPPGAAQEEVVASIGLVPVRDAVASLLNGSRFNFIMVGSDRDPSKLKSVILTYRGAGGMSQPAMGIAPPPPVTEAEPDPEPPVQQEMQPPPQEGAGQEAPPPPQENPPPQ